jgi:hypothetical protein
VSDRIIDVGLRPLYPVEPTLNMKVMKVGRTTGLTHAKVSVIDVNGEQIEDGSGNITVFNDLFEILVPIPYPPNEVVRCVPGSFGCGGDSGSTILEEDTSRPAGLLFAGGTVTDEEGNIYNEILGCKATNVAKLLGVSFLEPVTTAGLSFLASFSLTLLFSALVWPRK